MGPAIATQPALTDAEWSIVVELLQRERTLLPIEIHHTTTRAFREQLKTRLEIVEALLTRLKAPAQ